MKVFNKKRSYTFVASAVNSCSFINGLSDWIQSAFARSNGTIVIPTVKPLQYLIRAFVLRRIPREYQEGTILSFQTIIFPQTI